MSVNFNNHNIYTSGAISAASGIFSTLQVNSIPPSLPTSSGTAGQIAYDNDYLYVATSGNTWKRVALSSWSPDPYCSDVSLLLHMDGSNGSTTFTNDASTSCTITANGNAQVSTTTGQFNQSLALDGTGDYLSITSFSDMLDFGTDDFTIEAWVYVTSNGTYQGILETRTSAAYENFLFGIYYTGGSLRLDFVNDGGAGTRLTGTSQAISLNTWTHVALVRYNGVIKAYVGGNADATTVSDSSSTNALNSTAYIGTIVDGSYFNGYIDELRVTKMARYTANFTPSSTAFPSCSLS